MDPLSANPYTVFTLVSAPAVMTNASAVMSLTTSNRLARAVDRSREFLRQIEAAGPGITPERRTDLVNHFERSRARALFLVQALRYFQLAYGCLSAATLVALVGAALALLHPVASHVTFIGSIGFLVIGIGGLSLGASVLIRETHLAYRHLKAEADEVMAQLALPPLSEHPPEKA